MKGGKKASSEFSKQRIFILPGVNCESAGILFSCGCKLFGSIFGSGALTVHFNAW